MLNDGDDSLHSVAARDLLNAMAAGRALDHAVVLFVLFQALFSVLLPAHALVLVAALVVVPLDIALAAPHVLTDVAYECRAVILCKHMPGAFRKLAFLLLGVIRCAVTA